MDNYFIHITKDLSLRPYTESNTMDIEQITSAFHSHVSIKKVREVCPEINLKDFKFIKVKEESVKKRFLI